MPWLHLPKRVHYALMALCCLARAGSPVRAHQLAACSGIPSAQAAKILYLLTWAGFVSSRRGSKGGFWLRLPADRIRVRDVLQFFHPPRDRSGNDPNDSVLQVWNEIAASSHQTFEELSLADLLGDGKARESFRTLLSTGSDLPLCP